MSKRWQVKTRADVRRTYYVTAPDEDTAETASLDVSPQHEETVFEETLEVVEVIETEAPKP